MKTATEGLAAIADSLVAGEAPNDADGINLTNGLMAAKTALASIQTVDTTTDGAVATTEFHLSRTIEAGGRVVKNCQAAVGGSNAGSSKATSSSTSTSVSSSESISSNGTTSETGSDTSSSTITITSQIAKATGVHAGSMGSGHNKNGTVGHKMVNNNGTAHHKMKQSGNMNQLS